MEVCLPWFLMKLKELMILELCLGFRFVAQTVDDFLGPIA